MDMPEIPKFLRRTPAAQKRANAYWAKHPPKAMPLFVLNQTKNENDEAAAFRVAEAERVKNKQRAHFDRLKNRTPKGMNKTHRWDSRRNRWVPLLPFELRSTPRAPTTALEGDGRIRGPVKVAGAKTGRLPAPKINTEADGADIRQRLSDEVRVDGKIDPKRVKRIAVANGVWTGNIGSMNSGLQCMNVANRIKSRVLKEGWVPKW